jgi:hypothetical protein
MRSCIKYFIPFLIASCKHPEKAPVAYMNTIHQKLTPDYNNELVFFADLSLTSSAYRFFVIRLKDSIIINRGLCCNGKTGNNGEVIYSNQPGSNCSSQGAYKIGAAYNGKFGKAFKLHGLEETNSNAFSRNVVLHSYRGIPRKTYGLPICKSQGCPTVNPVYLEELAGIIYKSKKPVMLYIQ